jgi:hypothetical protein
MGIFLSAAVGTGAGLLARTEVGQRFLVRLAESERADRFFKTRVGKQIKKVITDEYGELDEVRSSVTAGVAVGGGFHVLTWIKQFVTAWVK